MKPLLFRLIAIGELLGVALLVVAQVAAARQGFQFTVDYLVVVIGVAGLTAGAGVLLFAGRPLGRRLSILVQALQVLNVSTAAFSYWVALGPVARLRLQSDGWLTQFGVYGNALIAFHSAVQPSPEYAVNMVALLACIFLLRHPVATTAHGVADVLRAEATAVERTDFDRDPR